MGPRGRSCTRERAMCGVAAMFGYHYAAPPVDREELSRIRDAMKSRGPDGMGEWFSQDQRVGIGHRRLSIIDLSEAGKQPMASPDGKLVISFNGEIYNYQELRRRLEQKGRRFRSNSDTEVLLALYQEKGEALFEELRGMYAFALWDAAAAGSLLLARDPYGIKPLYYADDGWTVRVASQVKALLAGGKISKDPEPAGVAGYFLLGSVPEPFTTYQEIRQVPAGSIVRVDSIGPSRPRRYFSIPAVFREAADEARERPASSEEIRQAVSAALEDSVEHHLVSDVPVGLFLSSGIDSGAILAYASKGGSRRIDAITLAFEEFEGAPEDEAPLASEVARLYAANHRIRRFSASDFKSGLPRALDAMDQPSIDGLNTYFVSQAAAECGLKVSLSGLGADELFGGYPSFSDLPRWVNRLAVPSRVPFLGGAFGLLASGIEQARPLPSPKMKGMFRYGGHYSGAYLLKRGLFLPSELTTVLPAEMAREGMRRLGLLDLIHREALPDPGTDYGRVASLEAGLYMKNQLLRDADWAGMAHSLEIRTPFVDSVLLKRVGRFLLCSGGANKKELLAGSVRKPLPEAVTRRAKTGFGIPVRAWLESGPDLDGWKRLPALARLGTPWSRRLAYSLYERMAA